MPKNFINGGYIFSPIALICSLFLTIHCAKLLLDTRKELGGNLSFSQIGEKTWGRTGKILVDVALIGSQLSFCVAYPYFIVRNIQEIIFEAETKNTTNPTPTENVNKWLFGFFCFLIYLPLVMVRKIEKLAWSHLFGDAMIIITVVVIFIYGFIALGNNHGFSPQNLKPI